MKAALLIIDMQNDFIKKGAILEVKGLKGQLGKVKVFIDQIKEQGIKVIYTRHCYDPKNNVIEAKLFPELDEQGLRKASFGWQIHEQIAPSGEDIIIDKTRYDAFFRTELKEILEKEEMDTVIIIGALTEVCCESTARSAMFQDYDVIFCSDLNFTYEKEMHDRTLKVVEKSFGKVMSYKEILDILG